jgi:hypothetical protein
MTLLQRVDRGRYGTKRGKLLQAAWANGPRGSASIQLRARSFGMIGPGTGYLMLRVLGLRIEDRGIEGWMHVGAI